jgi:hypothetical protein
MGTSKNPDFIPTEKATDKTTGKTTSHPTKQPEDGCQVVGYKLATYANQVIG